MSDKTYIIKTKRLGLRLWLPSDTSEFCDINADTQVMRHFPNTLSEEETLSMIDRINKHHTDHGYGLYATEILETGEFIGFIGFAHPRFEASFTPCIEIGWRLKASSWNKGYCTEGALACLEYMKDNINYDLVYSWTSPLNKPSKRIMQKIGMEKVGEFQHPLLDAEHALSQHVIYKKDIK